MGIELSGKFPKCENCTVEKIRKKNIPKQVEVKASKAGERIYLDISSMKHRSLGGNKHRVLAVDEATGFKKSFFIKKKSDQVDKLIQWFRDLKVKEGISVQTVQLDNSGENKALEAACLQAGLGIQFEYTAPVTPQQNGVVEQAFPSLMGKARAMMNLAGFTAAKRAELWCEAANTATLLDNLLVRDHPNKSAHELFLKRTAKYGDHLKIFGEMVVAKDHTAKTKIDSRGNVCVFLGYAENHAGDVHRLLNSTTGRILLSRDVQWLDKLWAEHQKVKRTVELPLQSYEEEEEEEELMEPDTSQELTGHQDTSQEVRRSQRSNKGVPAQRLAEAVDAGKTYTDKPVQTEWRRTINIQIWRGHAFVSSKAQQA